MSQDLLRVDGLSIGFRTNDSLRPAVKGASLRLRPGETAALVGESGSGKTLLARALVGLLPPGGEITGGRIWFKGQPLDTNQAEDFRALRGRAISFIFQEPLSSLNPALKIGLQLTEGLRFHAGLSEAECRARALQMLDRVRIADPGAVMQKYPHQLSGGMRQRVMIATALMMKPALLVADEPTTALDMIVQEEVLLLMKELAQDMGAAVLLITHDLSAVAALADTVNVMNQGVMVEQGSVQDILKAAQDPYTRKLLAASPQPKDDAPAAGAVAAPPSPLVEVRDLTVSLPGKGGKPVQVLDRVSFAIAPGETLAVIGESGSGKTTLSRAIAGLQAATSGVIRFPGEPTAGRRRALQFIFQDPFGSLDPRMRVGDIVTEGLRFHPGLTAPARRDQAAHALASVELDPAFVDRLPHQLSGGQRQRVSIARAIIMKPDFILADEPVSALDLTVQKQILDLLLALKQKIGFACLFVSHDMGVVEHVADRVGVLYRGRLVEIGPRAAIFNQPRHPYTRQLIAATLRLAPDGDHGYGLRRRTFAAAADVLPYFEPSTQATNFCYREVAAGHLVAVNG